jgi:DNA-binding ferritin-like protein
MEKLATMLRYMQFYAHVAHNLTKGPTFFADHEFLGDLYKAYENDYDSIVERCIGLGIAINLSDIHLNAAKALDKLNLDPALFFSNIAELEKGLRTAVDSEIIDSVSEGTRQLLGEISNQSEMRQYKIRQRLA